VIDCLVARVRLLWAPPGGRAWQRLALLVLAIYLVFTINLVLITEYRWVGLAATTVGGKAAGGMGRRSGTGLLVAILTVATALVWAAPAQAARLMCLGRPATIIGTAGNDTLLGTPGSDVIVGLGGEDTISGGDGADRICGGDARDYLTSGRGDDFLDGEGGDDVLEAMTICAASGAAKATTRCWAVRAKTNCSRSPATTICRVGTATTS
jgi:hypothetical protein